MKDSNRKPSFWDRVTAGIPPVEDVADLYVFDADPEATRRDAYNRAMDLEMTRFVQSAHFAPWLADHVAALEEARKERFKQLRTAPRHVKDRESRRKLERQNNKRR